MNRRWVLLSGIVAVLLALGLGAVVESLFDFVWAPVVVLILVEGVLLLIAITFRPETRLPFLCDPGVLFAVFEAQFFVFGPLLLPSTTFYAQTPIAAPLIAVTVLGFVLLLVMFLIGYHMPWGAIMASRLSSFAGGRPKFPGRWAENGLLTVGLGSCAVYIWYQGGLGAMVGRGYGQGKSPAVFIALFLFLLVGTFLMAWRVFDSRSASRGEWLLFVGVILFEVLFWGVLLGTRKLLFQLFFGLTAIFLLRRGVRALPRVVIPVLLIVLVLYLGFWGSVRGRPIASYLQDYPDPRYAATGSFGKGFAEAVAGPFGAACLVLELFPDREPYRYGGTLLVAILSPIPRAVWPNKPIGLGKELTWYLGNYYSTFYDPTEGFSVTPTLVGDFYANLGVFGILLGGLFLGLTCRVIAAYATTDMVSGQQMHAARVLIPATFLAGLVEIRADTAMLVLFYMYSLLPLLAVLAVFSFASPRAENRIV